MPPEEADAIPVSKIFLHLKNPRHNEVDREAQAIEALCNDEHVLELARDISRYGLNPLERFALIPTGRSGSQQRSTTYYAAEGNRRICALKLLNDPDLAPARWREQFQKLADQWDQKVKTVPAIIFPDIAGVHFWLERIHSGFQGGIGRRDWTADQKQRFNGGAKNRLALAVLDLAEQMGLLTDVQRKRKLTTATRFLGNDAFREALGLEDVRDTGALRRTRPAEEFEILFKKFINDLAHNKDAVNSRMNRPEIVAYARELGALPGITNARIEPEPISPVAAGTTAAPARRRDSKLRPPGPPRKKERVTHNEEIRKELEAYGNEKLISLYYSICNIELEHHTPIVAVGVWSFFETLTACAGRGHGNDFPSFLNKSRLQSFGIKGETVTITAALGRIREYGNTTKHHKIGAAFNGDQLSNDMDALAETIVACIRHASSQEC